MRDNRDHALPTAQPLLVSQQGSPRAPLPVVCSWSAGKDSAFALWTLLQDPAVEVVGLLTTLTEGYRRVSMSGVRERLLDEQAAALGLPLTKVWIPKECPNQVYEERMAAALGERPLRDVRHFAFGDLFLEEVRAYRETQLSRAGLGALFPLWARPTAALAQELIRAGFRATVVCVDTEALPASFAGRAFDERFLGDLPAEVDPCGERGEFHTFVWDAPSFAQPIACHQGEVVTRGRFAYADVRPGAARPRRRLQTASRGRGRASSPARRLGARPSEALPS